MCHYHVPCPDVLADHLVKTAGGVFGQIVAKLDVDQLPEI
jgi:hypothetical protein